MGNAKAAHHRGQHQRLSRLARNAYNANPDTVCARCGQPRRADDPWQAGHKVDGMIASSVADYQPEHQSCNTAAGARLGNQRKQGLTTTQRW